MSNTQQSSQAIEAKFNQTNVAVFQAVLTSTKTPLDIDWQVVMEKLDLTRPDNAQRQFKDAIRKLGLAYPKVGGPVVIAEDSQQVVPKKRAANKSWGVAPKKSKTEVNEEEADAEDEGDNEGKGRNNGKAEQQ